MPQEFRETREVRRENISSSSNDIVRELAERQSRVGRIKEDLMNNREATEDFWDNAFAGYRNGLLGGGDRTLAGQIISRLTPIGQEYSSKKLLLDQSRQDNRIDEVTHRDRELTLRAEYLADRSLLLEKIADENGFDQ